MKRFDEERNKILILIQRDNHNEPYAKIYYNGQDAFNLSPKNKEFANYIARRMLERQICLSYTTGTTFNSSRTQFDYEYDKYYCLVGSYTGKWETYNLIKALYRASFDKEIDINLFVTDDISDTICLVKDSVNNLDADGRVRAKSIIEKMIRSAEEVARDNAIKNNIKEESEIELSSIMIENNTGKIGVLQYSNGECKKILEQGMMNFFV